jgi:predicted tellurium resistance membrane protein TerC
LSELFTAENLTALAALTALEIVLGIDNVVFISILTGRLPEERRAVARRVGLSLAMLTRIALLFAISWVMRLTEPWLEVFGWELTGRDAILLGGGLFLIAKATFEIHEKLEGPGGPEAKRAGKVSFAGTITQILLLDVVFSLDSVITAVGMARALWVMITAVIVAVIVMLVFAGAISGFIERHPTMKMLALSFLVLIGVLLVTEGLGQHIERGYVYFAMAFSLTVELLNLRLRRRVTPVHLHGGTLEEGGSTSP